MRIFDRVVAEALPAVPRPLVRHFAGRYMAGESLDQALPVVRRLNAAGQMATVDVLGEFVSSAAESDAMVAEYERLIDGIADGELDANISVKLSGMGIELDRDTGSANIERLVRASAARGLFARIDMEHSGLTDVTLEVYRELRQAGLQNCGVVLQACLRRSLADVRALAPLVPSVRLVKGIYIEPRAIAYTDSGTISRNYLELLEELTANGSYVAVATHDPVLIDEALRMFERHGLAPSAYEFQMLLGVAEKLSAELVAGGRRVRIYVPYGQAWYSYAVRRLKENPSLAGHVARDTLRAPWR